MGPLLRWFVFNVAFGLLPFAFSVLIRVLHGEPPGLVQSAPELLFLSLMLSAVQMGETVGTTVPGSRSRDAAFCFFLLIGISSAVLYGVYVQGARGTVLNGTPGSCAPGAAQVDPACAKWMTFQSNVFSLSVWLAVATVSFGTVAELIRTRRSVWKPG